jgi:hypothetical protein
MVHRLPHIDHIHQRCADYIDTKMKRSPFLSQVKRRAEGLLDLIHGDLCGPITPATPDGKKYYLLLVDDKSRLMWVALLATKSDALAVLKKFHAKVCVLRTNNGGGDLPLSSSRITAPSTVLSGSTPRHTCHNKTSLWSGGTSRWWPWREAY